MQTEQMIQMAELAMLSKKEQKGSDLARSIAVEATGDTLDRIVAGTDDNFDVEKFYYNQKKHRWKKPTAIKAKNNKKEVNFSDDNDDEQSSPSTIPTLAVQALEEGYDRIENELSIKQTYSKIVEVLTQMGYEGSYFKDAVLSVSETEDMTSLIGLQIISGIDGLKEYIKEFLEFKDSIQFLETI